MNRWIDGYMHTYYGSRGGDYPGERNVWKRKTLIADVISRDCRYAVRNLGSLFLLYNV